eukprot:GDKK01048102.1.p1 GENE.GDKK01048102.1~~GDKK01048102.1.p1  ORF type:complete len:124 (-),score=15.83 GDKK01048102.1:114-485(-)
MKFDVCHHENMQWIDSLTFYADELKYFQKLIEEVKNKNTDEELLLEVNTFNQEFSNAKEVIENLLIGIKTQEERFADYAQAQSFLFDEQMELIHERQRSAFETLEKDFILHKHQFYRLLGKIL